MANLAGRPSAAAFSRRIRTPKAWNVDTVRPRQRSAPPASLTMRSFISAAALLVKVTQRMARAGTPRSSRCTVRWAMTRVLPEPAPASTRTGPSVWSTASRWRGLRSERSTAAGDDTRALRLPERLGDRLHDLILGGEPVHEALLGHLLA